MADRRGGDPFFDRGFANPFEMMDRMERELFGGAVGPMGGGIFGGPRFDFMGGPMGDRFGNGYQESYNFHT